MLTRRLRTAALALLAAGFLTCLACARVSGTDRIEEGMTLLQVRLVMLGLGEEVPVFLKVSGSWDHAQEQLRNNSYPNPNLMPRRYRWEDAHHGVEVRIANEGTLSLPLVVELRRWQKVPEFGTAWVWRIVASVAWLLTFILLLRAAFEPKPAVALNSPG